jgi:hypothetical protein
MAMNKYVPCPHCGSQNRETDKKCYQCDGLLNGEGPASPQVKQSEFIAPPGPSPAASVPGYRRTVEKVDRDSTVVHGLRSGALAGVTTGLICGLFCSMFSSMFASAITNSLAGIGIAGFVVFIVVFLSNVIYATIIGAILGGMNVLCYQADCLKFGSIAGIIVGVVLLFTGMGGVQGIIGGAANGALIGYLASFFERRVFRKQYAEL